MTDILEQLAEQPADVLWEAVRRGNGLPAAPVALSGGEGAGEIPPLTAALTALERQMAGVTRLNREEERREARRSLSAADAPGQGRQGGAASLSAAAAGEDPLTGAERLDRVFRRDSRRYDGGFFLY